MESSNIYRYFPGLSQVQQGQFEKLGELYRYWNARINVISRLDIDNLYERHILHSLSIAKVISFKPVTRILDAGTGGGFPGIPLAIMFPETHFHLVDSTAKKLTVIKNIAEEIGLKNVTYEHIRLESHFLTYDFIVSRAVASLMEMARWSWKNIRDEGFNDLSNGILYLKGGDLMEELEGIRALGRGSREAGKRPAVRGQRSAAGSQRFIDRTISYTTYPLKSYFSEPFFETKSLVHLF